MQPHIIKAYNFLDKHLPYNYTEQTQEVLRESKITVSNEVIRNVRTNRTTKNLDVLNALLKVAQKAKKEKESLLKLLMKQIQ